MTQAFRSWPSVQCKNISIVAYYELPVIAYIRIKTLSQLDCEKQLIIGSCRGTGSTIVVMIITISDEVNA